MKYLLIVSFLINFILADEPDAVLKIEKSVDARSKITIFSAKDTTEFYRKKVNRLFLSDFKVSGHFNADSNISKIGYNTPVMVIGGSSKYTLIYKFKKTPTGGASLDIKLFSGNPKKQILVKNYSVSRLEKSPFLIHKAVSDINKVAKYPAIDWINRYVVLSRYTGPKQTKILLADYTFTYTKTIMNGGLNLFPKWADAKQHELYYSHYGDNDKLTLYKLNIYTGVKSKIITSTGMLACSDVSKDGSKLLLTMAPNSQPDIYVYSGGRTTKITKFSGIDVGGKFADGGSSVVFVSNREGHPNIYKTPVTGGSVKKIVHHGSNNGSCDAYDRQVVYSSKESRKSFNIYLTDSEGSQTRPLTSGGINQFPRFSFDGNIVMYIKRTEAGNSIGFVNISANRSELFKMGINRIQSIDW